MDLRSAGATMLILVAVLCPPAVPSQQPGLAAVDHGRSTASISGRVIDSDGKPAPGERIYLSAPVGRGRYYPPVNTIISGPAIIDPEQERIHDAWRSLGNILTDDNGFYLAAGLPAGRYLVSVGQDIARASGEAVDPHDDFSNLGVVEKARYYTMTFYPSATQASEASVVELSEGAHAEGIDIRVDRAQSARRIIGRTIDGETGKPVGNCDMYISHIGAHGPLRTGNPGNTRSGPDGDFSIDRLIPGEFLVSAATDNGSEYYSEPVRVTISDTDATGVEVKFVRGHVLRGEVVLIGGGPEMPSRLQVSARTSSQGWSVSKHAEVAPDGHFTLTGLPPGQIGLDADVPSMPDYLLIKVDHPAAGPFRSIQMGDADLEGVRLVVRYGR